MTLRFRAFRAFWLLAGLALQPLGTAPAPTSRPGSAVILFSEQSEVSTRLVHRCGDVCGSSNGRGNQVHNPVFPRISSVLAASRPRAPATGDGPSTNLMTRGAVIVFSEQSEDSTRLVQRFGEVSCCLNGRGNQVCDSTIFKVLEQFGSFPPEGRCSENKQNGQESEIYMRRFFSS